ncbi:hypothetical protein CBR_g34676 [Chara braunii]|uniref:Uncharacterized protein n=1 Tax=Chara braunii TaxID=69332 RepID=A0A388JYY0_CHABU|nr:hypothetical protein CBR_g34676 [Chara braunii]|eukprot:GBG62975.1 hypothetical protein CBR_g34676 [Chara braunii]
MTNSRSAGQAKRGGDVLEKNVPVVEKKGRHHAKKRKVVAGGPSNAGKSVREEWVSDGESTEEDDAIKSGEEEAVTRKGSLLTRGALKINDTEVRTAGALAMTRTMGPPEGDRSVRAPSSPATPRQQPVKDGGGGSNAAAQGSGQVVSRTHAMEAQGGGAGVGSSMAAGGAGAGEGRGDGDDDDPLVNRHRGGYVKEGIEAATRLWVDDLRFWNEMEGHGLYKLIIEAHLYLFAITRGVQPPGIRRSIALPHNTTPQHKVEDESELKAAKERATRV